MAYTNEQLEELSKKDPKDLNPSEFLHVYRYGKRDVSSTTKRLNSDAELYEVFKNDPKSQVSANQFKLAVGRAGLSISHARASRLYTQFKSYENK